MSTLPSPSGLGGRALAATTQPPSTVRFEAPVEPRWSPNPFPEWNGNSDSLDADGDDILGPTTPAAAPSVVRQLAALRADAPDAACCCVTTVAVGDSHDASVADDLTAVASARTVPPAPPARAGRTNMLRRLRLLALAAATAASDESMTIWPAVHQLQATLKAQAAAMQ